MTIKLSNTHQRKKLNSTADEELSSEYLNHTLCIHTLQLFILNLQLQYEKH